MMSKDIGETVIGAYGESIRIIVGEQTIDSKLLDWRESELGGGELTLNEVSEQIDTLQVIYVWVETGLSGKIYQYGNYSDGKWHEHGTTKGYA